jgi:hypothetical protein
VLDHAVDILTVAVLIDAAVGVADMRPQMHARRVEPAEPARRRPSQRTRQP